MLDLDGHVGHSHGVQPPQAAQLAGGIAQAIEDHGPHKRLGLAPSRSHSAPKCATKAQVVPQLMQGEDVAVGFGAFDLDGKSRILGAPEGAVEAADERGKLCGAEIFEPPKVGNYAMPDLSLLVAIALHELKVLAPPDLVILAYMSHQYNAQDIHQYAKI